MRYMIIVKANRDSEAGVMPGEDLIAEMGKFHEELHKAGVLLDANGLQATSQGWRVRYAAGRRSVVEGPFSDAGLIAGYTLIKVRSREEALEWSRRYPNPAGEGKETEIEVRRVFEPEDFR